MDQQTPINQPPRSPPPQKKIKDEAARKPKWVTFPSLIWGRGKGSNFSMYFFQDCNLGQNQMELQTSIPQFKDEALAKANTRHFPTFDYGEGKASFSAPYP